jgi:BASS family bile acid:Na+ symporter
MSAPAFAYLLGLEGALSLTLLVLSMAVTPVTAPLLAGLVASGDLPLSGFSLGLRLFTLLAGSLALAAVLRRLLGPRRTEAAAQIFDGLNVVLLFIFAVALMDGVAAHVLAAPALTLGLTALAFAAALGSTALTALLFRRMGFAEALSLGLAVGHRNLGLMIAATGGALPDLAWLYFAVAQFPIYLSPQLVRPLARRILQR